MKEAEELFNKYKAGKCTEEEKLLLQKWFHHLGGDEPTSLSESDLVQAKREFRRSITPLLTKPGYKLWHRLGAAAAIVIVIASGIHFYKQDRTGSESRLAEQKANDIQPGGNKAVLTLADGRRIDLNEAENGELAQQSGIKVSKTADGQLIYTLSDSEVSSSAITYNTIETPYGGQYQVNLPDGSRVWLNSASSLRYPVRFQGKERRVEITGEAYFEIAPNPEMPFRVKNARQIVEVLGTHFNIMGYANEATTNTTLVEGSVKIFSGNRSKVISPGQQAKIGNESIEVVSVDTEEVIAWKNGYFIFKSEDVLSIMRQISRWYNVDIEYQGDVSGKVFGGRISRSRNVSEVLAFLQSTGSLRFKIVNGESHGKERRIIVMP